MKVIKKGKIPEAQPVQAECSHCHTVVEFLPKEVRLVSNQRDGDFYEWCCPVCDKIQSTDVPPAKHDDFSGGGYR